MIEMKPMNVKIFADSNILLYLNDVNGFKKTKAKEIVAAKPFISVQVVFECLNVCLRKLKMPRETSIEFVKYLISNFEVVGEEKETCHFALELFSRYSLLVFDAKIIATALDADCSILYSEDMQNKFVIDDRLTIVNPFIVV